MQAKNAHELARITGCGDPETPESAGAKLLLRVQADVIERHDYDPEALDWSDADAWCDAAAEIADRAPDVYTHERWLQFVDLAAYNEDLAELGGSTGDMTKDAGVALYLIAERLVHALVAEAANAQECLQ